MRKNSLSRRFLFMGVAATSLTAPALLSAQAIPIIRENGTSARNASGFRNQDWGDHFKTLGKATIVADTRSRALHFWDSTGTDYRVYPTSVPLTEELTRRGYTKIVRKKVGPSWTPTASMRERDPSLPKFLEPGPGNPLGTHAMYLDWPAYLIHGTHDTRKIGRRSSSGCIGLFNEMIAELYQLAPVGTHSAKSKQPFSIWRKPLAKNISPHLHANGTQMARSPRTCGQSWQSLVLARCMYPKTTVALIFRALTEPLSLKPLAALAPPWRRF